MKVIIYYKNYDAMNMENNSLITCFRLEEESQSIVSVIL